ncbi:uncharacterized protein BX664DRAFT_383500 [Halteromyces radiatus]|uniref:uncharacterized protein n=1 Tax=Halteromyces radiatus TaxID=101107 RepID=UPI002220ED7C|nr:uncharacterized protein BX664DRAFT_383500 [Halteromyces radiatus]KAI8097185.1 hypothetical protein BX664DRAFT_383500 [Halteromyces radiatus]
MDLSSLLNQGGSGLSTEDLIALQYCDSSEKLNKINNAAFRYPSNTSETYHFFDIFVQLVLSIHDADDEFGVQYTNTVIIGALRSCISGLLQQEGFNWLLDYPYHLSINTWNLLHSTSVTTFLIYLYGLSLGLKKQHTVSVSTWASSILQFLRVKLPLITCHIWLNFCHLEEQQQDTDIKTTFLFTMESTFWEQLTDVLVLLENGNALELTEKLENQLGGTLLRKHFTKNEMTLALISLENMIRSQQARYPRLTHLLNLFVYRHAYKGISNQRQSKKSKKQMKNKQQPKKEISLDINVNPLARNMLCDISLDHGTRSLILQQRTQGWVQQMGILSPADFDMYLQNLIHDHYPSEKKFVLDMVLVDWAARDIFGCHMELIINTLINLLGSTTYNMRLAPYYAWIQAFNLTYDDTISPATTAYNIKTGAEINISQFNTKHDMILVNGLSKILQRMTLQSSPSTKTWTMDCLRVASPAIVERYVHWLTQQLNQEFENKEGNNIGQESSFSSHLQSALINRNTLSYASVVVPTLLRESSDDTLAWLVQKKTQRVVSTAAGAGRILLEYFGEGTHLSSQFLVVDLLRCKTKNYMDTLFDYLCDNMKDTNSDSKVSRSWFYRHFLETLLSEAANDLMKNGQQQQQQTASPNVASQLYHQLLESPAHFEWFYTIPCTTEPLDIIGLASSYIWTTDYHLLLSVRDSGMASLLQCMTRLSGSEQQHLIIAWRNLWTTSTTTTLGMNLNKERRQLAVPIRWILQCVGLYDQAPPLAKQMMEEFLKIGIQTRIHGHEIIVDTVGQSETFTEQVMDLLMISDAPEIDGLFDLYLQLCQDVQGTNDIDQEDMVQTMVNTLISLSEELKLQYEYIGMDSGYLTGVKDMDTHMTSGGESSGLTDSDTGYNSKTGTEVVLGVVKSRKLRQSLLQEEEQQQKQGKKFKRQVISRKKRQKLRQRLKQRLEQNEKKSTEQAKNVMLILVQRLLNFLLVVLSESDGNSLCPKARLSIRDKLVRNLLLYEPLMTLTHLTELPADILDDVQLVIDISLNYLQKSNDDDEIYIIVQRMIGLD